MKIKSIDELELEAEQKLRELELTDIEITNCKPSEISKLVEKSITLGKEYLDISVILTLSELPVSKYLN